jgi:hypothetical protein
VLSVPLEPPFANKKVPGALELQSKINHLGIIVRSVLPSGDDNLAQTSFRLDELLGDEDEELDELSLPMIRMAAIRGRTHGHSWANNFVPAYMFDVGDYGYVPPGEEFGAFVKLGNVLHDELASWEIAAQASGRLEHFDAGRFERQELQPFLLPEDVSG